MKKSILIIATVAFSILNLNAINKKSTPTPLTETVIISNKNMVQVFDWNVETNKGIYSGTSLSIADANKMIALSSSGEIILGTEINATRNYFWEVETETGFAKGYVSSEDYANRMIVLLAFGNAIIAKIIISQPQ